MGKIYPQLEASGVRVIGVGMELLSPLTKLSHRVVTHNLSLSLQVWWAKVREEFEPLYEP
jgi:hypothetical protein